MSNMELSRKILKTFLSFFNLMVILPTFLSGISFFLTNYFFEVSILDQLKYLVYLGIVLLIITFIYLPLINHTHKKRATKWYEENRESYNQAKLKLKNDEITQNELPSFPSTRLDKIEDFLGGLTAVYIFFLLYYFLISGISFYF